MAERKKDKETPMTKTVSVSAIADLHGHLPQLQAADLAVVCGDIFPGGLDKDPYAQGVWFKNEFLPWVDRQECNHVILIAGNHDHWIEKHNELLRREYAPEAQKKLIYLCDSGLVFKGLKIYGTPWVPTPFVNKAFSSSNEEFLREKYSQIPQQVDLLLTHTVPFDCNHIGFSERDMQDLGSRELRKAVESRDIRFLIGGHIHASSERIAHMDFGSRHTEMANVACCDCDKQPSRLAIQFPISVEKDDSSEIYRIACVGDSITYGFGLDEIRKESYPALLGTLMGSRFEVKNFGRSGAGLWEGGAFPYTSTIEYYRAIDYDADVYVICLGTNDLVQTVDNKFIKAFKEDYKALIKSVTDRTAGWVYITTIPPVPMLYKYGKDEPVQKMNQAIVEIAEEEHIEVIDLYKTFGSKPGLFSDGVHPNPEGARLIAETVYQIVSNHDFKGTL